MGTYLNPGNAGFSGIRNDRYVDKTGLIGLINDSIDTPRRLTCISRPRRFGKSFAAQMLCAYYDKTDIVYLPKKASDYPALVIELKCNQSAQGAIAQIHEKKYPDVLKGYGGHILLVGVNYDKNAPAGKRKHSCSIQKVT